jgi:glutaredoxin 2
MKKLFLLKPDFKDEKRNPESIYFCPNCGLIEGILFYYPRLLDDLEVHHVDFKRPRPAIVELIGEENQSCPVLVHEDGSFINETKDIIRYLVDTYHIAKPH